MLLNEPAEREDEETWARLTMERCFAGYSEADAVYDWRGETIFMQHLPSTLLEEITERLVQGLHPEQIILFGSHAYGQPSEASDIDLLVIVADSHEPRHRRACQAYKCLRGLTAPTEVLVLTRREIAQAATVPTSFVNQALQRGRVLYG
jgi:predicted nucleotidyltransferase